MTRDEKITNLKPCPFCGAVARKHSSKPNQYAQIVHDSGCYFYMSGHGYQAIRINEVTWRSTAMNRFYESWNNRPDSTIESVTIYEAEPEVWMVTIGSAENIFMGIPEIRKLFFRENQAKAFVGEFQKKHSEEYLKNMRVGIARINIEGTYDKTISSNDKQSESANTTST